MKKLLLSLTSLLILAASLYSQTTSVTLQVTDTPDNQVWGNGTWQVQLQPLTGNITNTVFTLVSNGHSVPNIQQSGVLNPTGGASLTLTPNAGINPVGSQWNFTVCPQATTTCYSKLIFIFGANQTVTINPPSVRINASTQILAYLDSEVTTGIGQTYFNLTSNVLKVCAQLVCAGTGFTTIAGGGNGCIVNPFDSGCAISGNPTVDLFAGPNGVGGGTGWLFSADYNSNNPQIYTKAPITANQGSSNAGNFYMPCGTYPGLGSGVGIIAPAGPCTPWVLILPAAPDSGFFICSNSGGQVSCSFQATIDLQTNISNALGIANGGTGATTASAAAQAILPTPVRNGDLLEWFGTAWTTCPGNTGGGGATGFFTENGTGNCGYVGVPIPVADGGTGLTTITSNVIYKGNGTSNLQASSITDNGSSVAIAEPLIATGTAAGLTGTGACATITTQVGGSWAGSAKCTGTTGASTLTITPGLTATNGWNCRVQDETTRANLFQQTGHTTTTCTLTVTSVTSNDIFVFSVEAF